MSCGRRNCNVLEQYDRAYLIFAKRRACLEALTITSSYNILLIFWHFCVILSRSFTWHIISDRREETEQTTTKRWLTCEERRWWKKAHKKPRETSPAATNLKLTDLESQWTCFRLYETSFSRLIFFRTIFFFMLTRGNRSKCNLSLSALLSSLSFFTTMNRSSFAFQSVMNEPKWQWKSSLKTFFHNIISSHSVPLALEIIRYVFVIFQLPRHVDMNKWKLFSSSLN